VPEVRDIFSQDYNVKGFDIVALTAHGHPDVGLMFLGEQGPYERSSGTLRNPQFAAPKSGLTHFTVRVLM
jgi:hypothetical protein